MESIVLLNFWVWKGGGPRMAVSFFSPRFVLGTVFMQNQRSYTYFIRFHQRGSSPEIVLKKKNKKALVDVSRKSIVIFLNSHQLSKHGSYSVGLGRGRCWGRCSGWWSIWKKLRFWKEDFSLLKFLYGKHRFVKFLGLERGESTKGSKLFFPKVLCCNFVLI